MSDYKERIIREEKERREKVKRAIWINNKLIDTYPEIYKAMKEEYKREKGRE